MADDDALFPNAAYLGKIHAPSQFCVTHKVTALQISFIVHTLFWAGLAVYFFIIGPRLLHTLSFISSLSF
jgi:hypothetical protein